MRFSLINGYCGPCTIFMPVTFPSMQIPVSLLVNLRMSVCLRLSISLSVRISPFRFDRENECVPFHAYMEKCSKYATSILTFICVCALTHMRDGCCCNIHILEASLLVLLLPASFFFLSLPPTLAHCLVLCLETTANDECNCSQLRSTHILSGRRGAK